MVEHKQLPFGAKLLHQHLGTLWLHQLLHHSSTTERREAKKVQFLFVVYSYSVVLLFMEAQRQNNYSSYNKVDSRLQNTHLMLSA